MISASHLRKKDQKASENKLLELCQGEGFVRTTVRMSENKFKPIYDLAYAICWLVSVMEF